MTKNKTTITMTKLPDGSVIRGKVYEHSYVIDKIAGDCVAYAGASVYRVGDRITEKEAESLALEAANTVVTLKGVV